MKADFLRHFATNDAVIAAIVPLAEPYPSGLRQHGTVFDILARSIAGQQLSTVVARKIIERMVAANGGSFPTPVQLAATPSESLRAAGFSFAKIAALKDLAAHALDGRLPDDAALGDMDDEEIITRCIAVRGIGRWTAQMLLMFHFGRPDVMPADDFGVRNGFRLAYGLKGLPKPKALLAYAERWKPYRSAGAWYMWRAVELHQQGLLATRAGRAPRVEIVTPKAPRQVRGASRSKAAAGRAPRRAKAISAPKKPKPTLSETALSKAALSKAALNKAARAPRQ